MEKRRSLIKLLGVMVIVLMVLACTPKKADEQSAHAVAQAAAQAAALEARITALQAQLEVLALSEAEEKAVETNPTPAEG